MLQHGGWLFTWSERWGEVVVSSSLSNVALLSFYSLFSLPLALLNDPAFSRHRDSGSGRCSVLDWLRSHTLQTAHAPPLWGTEPVTLPYFRSSSYHEGQKKVWWIWSSQRAEPESQSVARPLHWLCPPLLGLQVALCWKLRPQESVETQRSEVSDQLDKLLSDGSAAAPPLSFIHELQTAASDDCCGCVLFSVAFK